MKRSILNSKGLAWGFAFGLFAAAGLYAVALFSSLAHNGCCLFYQTEQLHESISVSEHKRIGIAAYAVLCITLIAAAFALVKRKLVALVLLLVAIPIVANDTGGALFDSFAVMPWVPKNGAAFEVFFNIRKIPEKVWYVVLSAVVLAAAFCALHVFLNSRRSANKLLHATCEDARA